jgi:integrase
MSGFIRWQGKNSIAVYVPTGKKYKSGQPVREYETVKRAPGETDKQLEARANARKAEMELEHYHGTYATAPKKYTIERLLNDWLSGPIAEKVAAGDMQESTREKYEMYVRAHLTPRLGDCLLPSLTEADIESAYRQMAAGGKTQATIAGTHRTLYAALKWAMRKRLIRMNPADLVEKKPTDPKTIHPTLTRDGALKLIECARTSPHDAAILTALLIGARIGEVLGLHREDIDWENGIIHLVVALKKTGSQGPTFGPPKTENAVRDIPLKSPVLEILRDAMALVDKLREKKRARGRQVYDYGLVFANPDGRPINRHNLGRRAFRSLLNRAGLPRMRPHDLRHTFTTLTKELGIDSKHVADALGHADGGRLVDGRYGHRSQVAQEALFDQLYDYLKKRD